jgi:hypothetical protein
MAIDLIKYQLQNRGEKEFHHFAGVLVEKAARTTHRHRQNDLLAIFLSFSGEHRYSDAEINELGKTASGVFFHTQGSVTRAIQNTIEELNRSILEENLDQGLEGKRADGSVNISVIHNGWMFIGQMGDAHTYVIGEGRFERFGEEGESIEKLGRSKRVHPRLYQSAFEEGDLVLMSPEAHASWKAYYLSDSNNMPMSQVKRRLQNQLIEEFSVLVIKAIEGNGTVLQGDWETEQDASLKIAQSEIPSKEFENSIESEKSFQPEMKINSPEKNLKDNDAQLEKIISDEEFHDGTEIQISAGETEFLQDNHQNLLEDAKRIKKKESKFLVTIARGWMKGKTIRAKLDIFFGRIFRKIYPNKIQMISDKPHTWVVVATIAIPIVLIIASLSVFSQFGKEEQFNLFFKEAQDKALLVEIEDDPIVQFSLWKDILTLTNQAEEYLVTNESRQLYSEAQSVVDDMDLAARLDYRPALTQYFSDDVSISRIKASSSGVYLLNSISGNVMRIYLDTKGFYQLDEDFVCSPGVYGLATVTNLVDFVVLPANSENYKIMATDQDGNLLYCQPGEPPDSRTLTIPTGDWIEIVGTTYSNDTLYVMDGGTSMVWVYKGNETDNSNMSGIVFTESPEPFFDDDIPDLTGAIDISINEEDLYILHDDGHMTLCQYSSLKDVKLTECKDPAPFTDNRVGSENKKPWIFMGTHFIGMDQTKLSNASLFLLDNVSSTLYQFSFHLNLERTLKPQANRNYPLPLSLPTGFGITPDQEVFIAFENQLFFAPMK